jgi:tRNA A-37 threonylcarbamoyl transferase component Bud32
MSGVDAELHAALAAQRRDWAAGAPTPVAERLRQCPALAAEPARAAELVYHEFLLRQEFGAPVAWDDYLASFPDHAVALRLLRQADQLVEHVLGPTAAAAGPIGDYEILEEIGRGGMGVVYKAGQKSLGRVVALKMIRAADFAGPAERERFRREAQAVAALRHPNIVQVYAVGDCNGEPFLALEFVEGPSLARYLGGKPLPAREAAALVATLADAMHYAHQRGVIHRDLKPGNILLESAEKGTSSSLVTRHSPLATPKITDFGLAKLQGDTQHTSTGVILGTPGYMAPEQADGRGKEVGPAADVYGLGAILYELLTGRPPFQGDSPVATLQQVMEAEPARPRLLNPAVPRDLETVCLKCLEKEPQQRYASAAALADDLRRFRDGAPVRALPVGAWGHAQRWCRRKPLTAGLLALLAVAVAAGVAAFAYQLRQTNLALANALERERQAKEAKQETEEHFAWMCALLRRPVDKHAHWILRQERDPHIEPTLAYEEWQLRLLMERRDNDPALRTTLALVLTQLGASHFDQGRYEPALACLQRAARRWE